MAQPREELRIVIVACEPSGDALGARLIEALRERSPAPLAFTGIGGERMAGQGFESLFPLREFAVMGFVEVLPRIPAILGRQRELVRHILAWRPDAVVTIDSSSFNKGLARRLIRSGSAVPRIHYVAPMVWAWRPGRARRMAALFDALLTLFPFEPPLFEKHGLKSICAGHPAVEAPPGNGVAFRRRHAIPPDAPLLCLLPGSRPAEIRSLLPTFRAAADLLGRTRPDLHIALPTVASVADMVAAGIAGWAMPARMVLGEDQKRDAFAASDAALAASGTVTLELGLAGVPMVVSYRPNRISGWLAARLIRIPHVSLVNLLLDRPLVPELLRGAARPDGLAEALLPLLADSEPRRRQAAGLAELRRMLVRADGIRPSGRAADAVLALASGSRRGQIRSPDQNGGI